MRTIRRVGVLGAGTMGSQIAAHLANAGLQVRLLDIASEGERNALAEAGLKRALNQKPSAFFSEDTARLISTGNFEDDFQGLSDCDWIIEAVTEELHVKRALWTRVNAVRQPDAILSTNTSGIPLVQLAEGMDRDFRRHFLGTHFFNPPRYLHLVEIIPGPGTDHALVRWLSDFCEVRLGKGVVRCKDTPSFIANRIGSFWGSTIYKLTVEGDYRIEEVDALTGPLIGLPGSASYRLLDMIGLDVWTHVGRNLYESLSEEPWHTRFEPPAFVNEMLGRGWLGDKAGQGFYKKVGPERERYALDWKTLEYRPAGRVDPMLTVEAQQITALPKRLEHLISSKGRAGFLLWNLFRDVFLYSAERVPEISDRIVEIDRAMRWGYGHAYGPFELWDAIGFEDVCDRIEQEDIALPANIERMRRKGAGSFYRAGDHDGLPQKEYFDLHNSHYKMLEQRPGVYVLADVKRARGVVQSNASASLLDLGDGVLCCEFHSSRNILNDESVATLHAGLIESEKNFAAMIVANQGDLFSAGADLATVLSMAEGSEWDALSGLLQRIQLCLLSLKYAAQPVVAAPFGKVLDGGLELVMHCACAQASAESYMGFTETVAGLLPGGGGCKEVLIRLGDPHRAFGLVFGARMSGSAAEARSMGLLGPADRITMNPERMIGDAKALALSLVSTWAPRVPQSDIDTGGTSAFEAMVQEARRWQDAGEITEFDYHIAERLAHVLSGGTGSAGRATEQQLLQLEREAYLSLCGEAKCRERMASLLRTGRPLKN